MPALMRAIMKEGDLEFLRALHEEKIRAQNERAELIGKKLTFIVLLFGVSSLDLGINFEDLYWLIYFIPMIAISHDLYIMSADLRIKRIGRFLGNQSISSLAGDAEIEWENFCIKYTDNIGPSANMFFSFIVTVSAAVFIYVQKTEMQRYLQIWFAAWLIASLSLIMTLWLNHKVRVASIGELHAS
jgi:hypothetical protein